MVVDSETLEKNALTLLKKFPDAKKILQETDGKKDYQKIAQDMKVNPKTTSPALNLAKDLGFAEKIKPGIYKKITSNMKYIPNNKRENNSVSVKDIVKRFSKKKLKESSLDETRYSFNFKGKVEKMAEAYKWLFITENTLREIIRSVFTPEDDWWKNRVPKDVQTSVENEKLKIHYDGAKRKDELDYAHIGQLKNIITCNKNWKLFSPHFKKQDVNTINVDIERVIPSRNSIGHCISLDGDDYKYTEMRFKAILKLLK